MFGIWGGEGEMEGGREGGREREGMGQVGIEALVFLEGESRRARAE